MLTRITATEQLEALPEGAVVVTETEDATSGEIFAEAFQKNDGNLWWSTQQGDYAESTRPAEVLRPWMAGKEDTCRTFAIYAPEARP